MNRFDTFYTIAYRGEHIHAKHDRFLAREVFTTSTSNTEYKSLRAAKLAITRAKKG